MLVFSDVQSLCISARLWLQVGSPKRLRSDLNQTVSFPPTLFSSSMLRVYFKSILAHSPGYKRVPGGAERVEVEGTGQTISDRAYKKIARLASNKTPTIGGQKVITNEALAKLNKQLAPLESAARPARGRVSLRKLDSELQREFALGRIEAEKQKVESHKARVSANKLEQKIKYARAKPTKLPRKQIGRAHV